MSRRATRWLERGSVPDPLAPPPPSVAWMVVPVLPPLGLPGTVEPVVPPPPAPGAPFGGWKGFLLPKTSNVSSGADAVVVVVGLAVVGVVIGGGSATLLPLPE